MPVPLAKDCDIPATAALDHVITVLPVFATVELVAVYANVVPLQIVAGVNELDNAGVGLTFTVTVNAFPKQPAALTGTTV